MKIQRLVYYLLTGLLSLLLWPTITHAQTETTYIHGNSLQPLVEAMGDTQTLNIYDPDGRLITQVTTNSLGSGDGQTRYLLHDHLGSTRVVVNGSNQVLGNVDYTPFGQTTAINNGTSSVTSVAYRYTGQQLDDELSTYNYHARFYDPTVGRFNSVDPGRQYSSAYIFVGDNPINLVDLNGEQGDIPIILYGRNDPNFRFNISKLDIRIYQSALRGSGPSAPDQAAPLRIPGFAPEEFSRHFVIAAHHQETAAHTGSTLGSQVSDFSIGQAIGQFATENRIPIRRITHLGCRANCGGLEEVARGVFTSYTGDSVEISGTRFLVYSRNQRGLAQGDPPFLYSRVNEQRPTYVHDIDTDSFRILVPGPRLGSGEYAYYHRIGFTGQRFIDLIQHGSLINDAGNPEPGFQTRTFSRSPRTTQVDAHFRPILERPPVPLPFLDE